MGVELEEDLKRKMIELNLAAARHWQSPQTGYIHSPTSNDTIPLLENFCFALALFRSRLADHIVEAKTFLEKLLAFEVDGNFPVHLHEFPQCHDRTLSLELLPVLHWILTDFRPALGETLTVRLELLLSRIVSHGYRMHAQRPLAMTHLFRLKSYFEPNDLPPWTPSTPEEWAHALISEQIQGSQHVLLTQALEKWDTNLAVFKGLQHQDKSEPKVTLLDLLMGHYHGLYSQRALTIHPVHLLASMIPPLECPQTAEKHFEKLCTVFAEQSYSFYWGSLKQVHSLFIDYAKANCVVMKNGTVLEWTLELPKRTFQEGEDAIEIAAYLDVHPDHSLTINGAKATTFRLQDQVEISSTEIGFKMEFSLEQGEGRFFGHLLRGNRPTQKAKLKFEAFDWQIALRTIRRTEKCVIKLRISLS
jgi:hypothetical protein